MPAAICCNWLQLAATGLTGFDGAWC